MKRAALVIAAVVLALGAATALFGWREVWMTPDQRGAWLLARGEPAKAAIAFADPVWRGVALMRAGQYEEAASSFAESDGAIADYDRGNALVMLGRYDQAIAQYAAALRRRPGWADAAANRALAELRAQRLAHQPGEVTNEMGKVEERYSRDRSREAQGNPNDAATPGMSDEAIRSLWLRRVQTRPADFLRARFAFQLEHAEKAGAR